jgi:hypothetical protein
MMSADSKAPTRRDYRFPAGVPATVDVGGRSIPCSAENLSRSGVLLVGRLPSPAVERLEFTLKTPNGSFEVQLVGRAVRIDHDPARDEAHLAVEFVDLAAGKREELEVFLARLLESPPSGTLEGLRPGAAPHEVKKVLEAIPLPQRISLAQRGELKQREILRQDQHPAVLESVVHNPNLTLAEARALAASPFLMSGTIDLLAGDLRFRGDEELRMVLATHPRVSTVTAEKLTADFTPPQIKKLFARPGLNQLLREKLFRKLTRGEPSRRG